MTTENNPLQAETGDALDGAIALARQGDLIGARRLAEQMLVQGRDSAAVRSFLGVLCCQSGDLAAGIGHFRGVLALEPDNAQVRANLVTALIQNGQSADALALCDVDAAQRDSTYRLWRLRAYLLQLDENFEGAVAAYSRVVAAVPDDFESWNNLGNAHAATGDAEGSVSALRRASTLRPDIAPIRLNLATTLIELERLEEALVVLEACTRDFPRDPKPFVERAALLKKMHRDAEGIVALEAAAALDPRNADLQANLGTELVLAWRMTEAEDAYRNAIAIRPDHARSYVHLAILLDHMNRTEEFAGLIASAERAGIAKGSVQLMRALAFRRQRRFEEGLAALADVPEDVEPVRRAQLAGQFHDGLGNAEAAFLAFAEMNRQVALDPSQPLERAAEYRARLRSDCDTLSMSWYRTWQSVEPGDERQTPVFLLGFPRSGTTLLDTMLMGHPAVQVLEERPMLSHVEQALGDFEKLADLDAENIAQLRKLYFDKLEDEPGFRRDALLIDKNPLHINRVPLIHRLFPDARFILALRHPLDAVLSCYITNFRLNNAMASFTQLQSSAELYDLSFRLWEKSRSILPLRVRELHYERLVADRESELRSLFEYLELDWHGEVLNHTKTAAERGIISTASYAQVTEPIYQRAAGRWTRYRDQLQPIIPILKPWVETFGYTL